MHIFSPVQFRAYRWLLFLVPLLLAHNRAADHQPQSGAGDWSPFVEPNFPFFSSVLDARQAAPGWATNNLTPRGLILNLGHDMWACFDTDLLRVSAIWHGHSVTPVSMAQGSWSRPKALVKAPEGQGKLPQISGTLWLANGIYPGWQSGSRLSFEDPREPAPDPREIGRGPLAQDYGRFKAIRLTSEGFRLEYEISGIAIEETIFSSTSSGTTTVHRHFQVAPHSSTLLVALGAPEPAQDRRILLSPSPQASLLKQNALNFLQLPPAREPVSIQVALGTDPKLVPHPRQSSLPGRRWPQEVVTQGRLAPGTNTYVIDEVALPLENPWRRNVRLADIAFFRNGTAAAVTFDGDVWLIRGLQENLRDIKWTRFTSGLHEPMGIVVRNEQIFVFDRNGIWRLRDTDHNGEADLHELFSNVFSQTAETREFTAGFKLAPDGSFIIAKGGQQTATIGRHNGSVLRISPDGRTATLLGYGLRQPFIGVHPQTGLVTASDQQGHYIPSTPLHIISGGQYYGFIPVILPKEKYPAPIADPLTWIPHPINASGASQVWLTDPRSGPLAGSLIHLGYYRTEMFLVRLHHRASRPQAAVLSLTREFDFPLLNGTVNPADGQLYLTGFQIWGTVATNISGLARFRYNTGPSLFPLEVVAMDQGILLKFEVELDPASVQPANLSAERWNYRRSPEYGSAHYKLDGSKGQENLTPSSAYLSRDRKSLFIGIPDMRVVMQMRLGWTLATSGGTALAQNTYFTPHELLPFKPSAEGFDDIEVDLTPRTVADVPNDTPVTVQEGQRLAELMGCVACHSSDGSTLGKVGPTWKALFKSERKLASGAKVFADDDYLNRAIRQPTADILAGFDKSDTGMPSYEGILTDPQIEALILYIKSL